MDLREVEQYSALIWSYLARSKAHEAHWSEQRRDGPRRAVEFRWSFWPKNYVKVYYSVKERHNDESQRYW